MLTILHTNDFHGCLTPDHALHLRTLRKAALPDCLLLDAGDAVSAGNITFKPSGEPILDQMSAIGYDAMTVGNREFHFSLLGFQRKLCRAQFPVLCANVRPTHEPSIIGSPPWSNVLVPQGDLKLTRTEWPVVPFHYQETASGWRIVIFGITVPMITEHMTTRKISSSVFEDPIAVAKWIVPQLQTRFKPDLLIALTHIGIQKDRMLAAKVPEIDLIIGGHTHVVLEKGETVGETLIVQAGSHARYVGRIEVERNLNGQRPQSTACLEAL